MNGTEDRDLGAQALVAALADLDGAKVTAGIYGGTGAADVGGASMAEAAFYNEFGTVRAPERPWMRSTVDKKRGEYDRQITDGIAAMQTGAMQARGLLTRIGMAARNDFKQAITDWNTPPNAPSTIERKGFNDPLMDTGATRNAINFRVDMGGGSLKPRATGGGPARDPSTGRFVKRTAMPGRDSRGRFVKRK